MKKYVPYAFAAAAVLGLLLEGCSSSKSTENENKKEEKPAGVIKAHDIKNIDLEERNYIAAESIKSIDKIKFEYNSDG